MQTSQLAHYLQQAVDQGMEGFAILDSSAHFIYVNPAHAGMYGYEPEDFIGQNWTMLYQPAMVAFIANEAMVQLRSAGCWRGQVDGLRKDKTTFPVEIALTELTNDAGEFDGLVCNCRDITESKLAQESVNQLQKSDALGQLTGGIAHDFNNLLSVILGNIDLSLTQQLPKDAQRQLQQAYAAGQRGAELVSRLLAFARAQQLKPKSINLHKFMATMSDLLGRTIEESVTLSWHVEPNVSQCHADPTQLESAVLNLVINARDALPQGGKIDVRAYNGFSGNGQPVVHIAVEDNGEGASPAVLEQMFNPFFTTKGPGKNSGLGLNIVQGFAKQSGGDINIKSQLGKGTLVEISLPAVTTPNHPQSPAPTTPISRKIASGERLLLVEDDAHVRDTTTRMLRYLGFNVDTAADGQQAMTQLNQLSDIALVLCDIRLPGKLQGGDIAEYILAHKPDLGCLLMTGYAPPADPNAADAIRQRLAKPFTIDELSNALKPLLLARNLAHLS